MIPHKIDQAAKRFFHALNALLPLFARPGAATAASLQVRWLNW
jgi:hypothetical protein